MMVPPAQPNFSLYRIGVDGLCDDGGVTVMHS